MILTNTIIETIDEFYRSCLANDIEFSEQELELENALCEACPRIYRADLVLDPINTYNIMITLNNGKEMHFELTAEVREAIIDEINKKQRRKAKK